MPGIIRDPRPNQTEKQYGILWDINTGSYKAYNKGNLKNIINFKRYIPAGVMVNYANDSELIPLPKPDIIHNWDGQGSITHYYDINLPNNLGTHPVYDYLYEHLAEVAKNGDGEITPPAKKNKVKNHFK